MMKRSYTFTGFLALLGFWLALIMGVPSYAQSNGGGAISAPAITLSGIEARTAQINENTSLSGDEKTAILEVYAGARARLEAAEVHTAKQERLSAQAANPEAQLAALDAEIEAVAGSLDDMPALDEAPMTDESLLRMEQQLIELEERAEDLRVQRTDLTRNQGELGQRTELAREERRAAQAALADVETQIAAIAVEDSQQLLQQARTAALYARRYNREQELRALAAEITYSGVADRLTLKKLLLVDGQLEKLDGQIQILRERTGQRRAQDALMLVQSTLQTQSELSGSHPLLVNVAAQNVSYANQIATIASAGGNTAIVEANVNSLLQQVADDVALADQILAEGNIDRKYGAVLRRLRANMPESKDINAQIDARLKTRLDVSLERILAQDQLKTLTSARNDMAVAYRDWFDTNASAPALSGDDIASLQDLRRTEQSLLTEIVSNSGTKIAKLADINTAQQDLLARISNLEALLDSRLLWLPSTEPLSLAWPGQTISGAATIFHPRNFIQAGKDFGASFGRQIWLSVFLGSIFLLTLRLRPALARRTGAMKDTVGRVRKDSLLSTPMAVFAGPFQYLPYCLLGFWAGLLLYESGGANFTLRLGLAIMLIAGLVLGLLTIRHWSRDGGLFDLHFKVRRQLRERLRVNLRWFIVTESIAILLMTLCTDHESETVRSGIGLLGFLIGTTSLAYLIYRLLWSESDKVKNLVRHDSFIGEHRKTVFGTLLALPVLTSLLAVFGYFATALEVQNRLILSGGLLVAAYVLYGIARRTVVVSERRLALQQALARREQALREREKRADAEQRGDVSETAAEFAVNYEEIDLETLSRQSTQLLNIVVFILLGAMGWVLWADLLPALSVFNDVKLPFDKLIPGADGTEVEVRATLWDFIKAIFTGFVTFFAAKNLPGFLDLFILKRRGITAGSRYAITTVLGYIIVIMGVLTISNQVGIEWSNLQWIIAALGVGIGFGLQEIIANFISGLIILFERPVRIGDYVTIGDQSGTINRIKIRATTLSDLDNREILIPNRELIAGRVTNWTLSNSVLRSVIHIGIAYGSDTDQARKIMMEVVKNTKGILEMPEPQVFFLGFGDSALDFEIRVFIPSFTARYPISHEIHTQVNKALAEANISIPFPQRDVHIITPDAPAVKKPISPKKPTTPKKSGPKNA